MKKTEIFYHLNPLLLKKEEREQSKILAETTLFFRALKSRSAIQEAVDGKVYFEVLEEGDGEPIAIEDQILLHFKEYASDGAVIKESEGKPFIVSLAHTIKGFQLAIAGAKVKERRKMYIHPDLGYGKFGECVPLIYEIFVVERLKRYTIDS